MTNNGPHVSLPRRHLGRMIREARQAANLRQGDVAGQMQWSLSKLSRLERGDPGKIHDRDIELLGWILELTPDDIAAMIGLSRQRADKQWWYRYGESIPQNFDVYTRLEANVRKLEIYRPDVIPGLFQTPGYAAVLDSKYAMDDSPDAVERRRRIRARRHSTITRKFSPASVDAVLPESALHADFQPPAVREAQLARLIELSSRPNITIRILPFSAGLPLGGPVGPVAIMDFAVDYPSEIADPTVACLGSLIGELYLEDERDIHTHRTAFAILRRAAWDEVRSRNYLRQIVRQRRSGAGSARPPQRILAPETNQRSASDTSTPCGSRFG